MSGGLSGGWRATACGSRERHRAASPRRTAFLIGSAIAALGAVGCGGDEYGPADNPTEVRDVSGVPFGWSCHASGCQVTLTVGTPAPDACTSNDQPGYSYSWGRFFDVCSVCVPSAGSGSGSFYWSSTPGQCRILACATSADCPVMFQASPVDVYECVDGLCENADVNRRPRAPLQRVDAEELCFAAHPRADTATLLAPATVAVEAELDAACTGSDPFATCALPADCRAP
jgi:hypothetical protein